MRFGRDWALENGLRVMEYRPWREGDAERLRSGFTLADEGGVSISDPVVDSLSIGITADGPTATVIVVWRDPDGLPLKSAAIDTAAIMPYHFLQIGEVLMPIGHVTCIDRIRKMTVTFGHVGVSRDRDWEVDSAARVHWSQGDGPAYSFPFKGGERVKITALKVQPDQPAAWGRADSALAVSKMPGIQ